MPKRVAALAACLVLAAAAQAEIIYKYRRADGRIVYSSTPIPGLQLIESVEHKYPPAAPPRESEVKAAAESEQRIRTHQERLQAAWQEVQEARRGLDDAEARLQAGQEPLEGERLAVAPGRARPGAAKSQVPRGNVRSRLSEEYWARVEALEAEAKLARARLDEALRRYNSLR